MIGKPFFDQYMTIEPCHLLHRNNTDPAKGARVHIQHLSIGHIGSQARICRRLKAEQDYISGLIRFQSISDLQVRIPDFSNTGVQSRVTRARATGYKFAFSMNSPN